MSNRTAIIALVASIAIAVAIVVVTGNPDAKLTDAATLWGKARAIGHW